MQISVINGPNLNLLGTRQPEIYGDWSLDDVENACRLWAAGVSAKAETYQSNHEGELIDRLHRARDEADAVVINPGALGHYSYAIRDAIEAIETPTVEVHISNVMAREPWRRRSVITEVCVATIFGRGVDGYRDAIWHLVARAAYPMTTIPYGSDPAQAGDLRIPEGQGPHRVAMLLHGGFWRDTAGRDLLDAASVELTINGWATWNVEYRPAGSEEGWEAPMTDVASALEALATLAPEHDLDLERLVIIGYEAGGQLALTLGSKVAGGSGSVQPAAIAGIAAVSSLEDALRDDLGDGAVGAYIGEPPSTSPDRYTASSPLSLLPIHVPLLVMHGDDDDVVPVQMSRTFAGQAADAGDEVVYHELETVGHDDLSRPGTMAFERLSEELERLSRRAVEAG